MNQYKKSQRVQELEKKFQNRKREAEEIRVLLNDAEKLLLNSGIEVQIGAKSLEEILEEDNHEEINDKVFLKENHKKPVIISVDCEKNNEEDIKAGGPEYLGYDFVVDETKVEEMRHYIALIIKKSKQPLIRTYVRCETHLKEENIWTIEEIQECVKKGYK